MTDNVRLYLIACFLSFTIGLVKSECHRNWDHYGDYCYFFSEHIQSWFDAQQSCQNHNARLVEVHNLSDLTFLYDKAQKYGHSYWLGARDHQVEGQWEWSSNGAPVMVTDWYPGQPNNYKVQNCLRISSAQGFHWDDFSCTSHLYYICQSRYPGVTGSSSIIG